MRLRLPIGRALHAGCWLGLAVSTLRAQSNGNVPAAVPAGADSPALSAPKKVVSARDARAADNAYVEGAKHIQKRDYEAAEKDFGHALGLNPLNPDYMRAFAFAREGRVSALVHAAAAARIQGRSADAAALLKQAHDLDPDNRILEEHLENGADAQSATFDPLRFPAENIASTLAGPVQFAADATHHPVHLHGDAVSAIRDVFHIWNIDVQFDQAPAQVGNIQIDLDDADFHTATAFVLQVTKSFAVPVQPRVALVTQESEDNRNRLEPQVEETFYLPGVPFDRMQELAAIARDVLGIKTVTASGTAATLLVRTDPETLKVLNATYADMLDGSSDVMLDMAVYEVDRSKTRNLGVQFPSGVSLFSIASELQNALNANAAALQAAKNAGLISQGGLSDNQFKLLELGYLYQAGLLSSTQSAEVQSLIGLGYIGTIKGLPIAGVSLASGASVNALLQSSDARLLDTVVLRATSALPSTAAAPAAAGSSTAAPVPPANNNPNPVTNGLASTAPASASGNATTAAGAASSSASSGNSNYTARFRTGERYPIETSSYTTGGASSAISSALAGASPALQQAAAQYLGSASTVTIPQISYEELGLTLEATPTVQHNRDVRVGLHFKIEALGSGSLNGIPVLNNREFTSVITVPSGQTAVLTSEVNASELRSIQGFPGLNELPGFQGTERDAQLSTQELLITLTPHVVRDPKWRVESRPIALPSATLH